MRKAIIDLGTNTFNLLIAEVSEGTFQILHSEKDGVAIGMGGINENTIAPASWDRAIKTLMKFKKVCSEHNVTSIRAIGTSALRSANNAQGFVDEVGFCTGINIEIISGLEEAAMIYDGVCWSYDFSKEGVIMDIGGGSTEFVWANNQGIINALSLDIGVSRMYQSLTLSDPLTQEDIFLIEQWLEEKVNGALDNKNCDLLIGASGTFETFYELHFQRPFTSKLEALKIEKSDLEAIIQEIIDSTLLEREQNEFIIPIRKKMAPIAAVKTRWVMKKLGVKEILISPCSLKEGGLK